VRITSSSTASNTISPERDELDEGAYAEEIEAVVDYPDRQGAHSTLRDISPPAEEAGTYRL